MKHAVISELLCIGQEDWDEVWRRNQFLIAELARRYPRCIFLFLELPCDFSHAVRTRQILRSDSPFRKRLRSLRLGVRATRELPNVHLLVTPKLLPDTVAAGHWLNNVLAAMAIRRAMRSLGMRRPLVWTQHPFAARLVELLPHSSVIYDVTDDWSAAESFGAGYRQRVMAADLALARMADIVLVCSADLYEKKRKLNLRTHLVPNAVDSQHFAGIDSGRLQPIVADLPRPIFGYTGTLHDERLDIGLIEALAARYPAATLLFVGPNHLVPASQRRLERLPNVRLIGSRPYSDMPAYLEAFDVCILPHRVNAFTESLNPLKVFEYLSSRRPIVSTAVAGMRDYPTAAMIAHSHSEFLDHAGRAIEGRGAFDPSQAMAIARANSWTMRVDTIMAIIGNEERPGGR